MPRTDERMDPGKPGPMGTDGNHPPTRTANEKPWFSIGDLHIIYIYMCETIWGCLILGGMMGDGIPFRAGLTLVVFCLKHLFP